MKEVMSVPGSGDAPLNDINYGYFELKRYEYYEDIRNSMFVAVFRCRDGW
jgi:hypothetical protein